MTDEPTSDEEYLAEVVPFPRAFGYAQREAESKLDELPVRTARAPSPCRHGRSVVDVAARTVSCRDCGVALDPVAVLGEFAARREALVREGIFLSRQVAALRQTRDALEREERNAKARIRSARRRRCDEAAVDEALDAIYSGHRRHRLVGASEKTRERLRRELRPGLEAYVAALEEPLEASEAATAS